MDNKIKIDKRIILTGPPGAGKSLVADLLLKNGYKVISEPARDIINSFKKIDPNYDPKNDWPEFQKCLVEKNINNWLDSKNGFFDRSLIDEIGFRSFYKMDIKEDLIKMCRSYPYDLVFFFPYWKEIFKNDSVRKESPEEAELISKHLLNGYERLGYKCVQIPKVSIEDRVKFILKYIKNEI